MCRGAGRMEGDREVIEVWAVDQVPLEGMGERSESEWIQDIACCLG